MRKKKQIAPFSMDNDSDRTALIERLALLGVPAATVPWAKGVVVIFILDNQKEELYLEARASLNKTCHIDMSGYRTAPNIHEGDIIDCELPGAYAPDTLEQAVKIIAANWERREKFIEDFRAGQFDLPKDEDEEEPA